MEDKQERYAISEKPIKSLLITVEYWHWRREALCSAELQPVVTSSLFIVKTKKTHAALHRAR